MLGKLFGSNARVKILKLFLLHPEKKYKINDVARDLKLRPDSAKRELENLENFGILAPSEESEKDGERKKIVYSVNASFILYEEIKTLIIKAQILYEKDFILKLKKIGKPKLLIFTGFFANNNNSSVDLLVVGRFNKIRFLRLIKELEKKLGREVNFTLMDKNEFKYRMDITDVFLYNILEGKKMVVIDEMGIS